MMRIHLFRVLLPKCQSGSRTGMLIIAVVEQVLLFFLALFPRECAEPAHLAENP